MADDVTLKISANAQGVEAGMKAASAAVQSGVAEMKAQLDGLQGAFAKVNAAMAAVTAVLAGGAAFKAAIGATVDLTKESVALGKQFGMSATDASVMKVAMDSVFVSQDQVSMAASKITKALVKNEDAFSDLGVATRDSNGNFRSTKDIMLDTNEALLKFKEGTDRNVEGMKIYGKSWSEVAPTLKLTRAAMEEAQKTAVDLHLVVGEQSVAATARYRSAMQGTQEVLHALEKSIGDAVLPILSDLGEWFRSVGPQAVEIMRGAMVALGTAFYGVQVIVATVFDFIKLTIQQAVTRFASFADAAQHALKFDFKGAVAAWQEGTRQIGENNEEFLNRLVQRVDTARGKVTDLFSRMLDPETATKSKGGGDNSDGGGKDDSGKFDKKLEELRAQYQEEARGSLERIRLAEQIADRVKQIYGTETKDFIEAKKLEISAAREAAAQILKLDGDRATGERDAQLKSLDTASEVLKAEHSRNEISNAEYFRLEQLLIDQKAKVNETYFKYMAALRAGDKDAQQKYLNDLAVLEQEHLKESAANAQRLATETKKANDLLAKDLGKMFDPVKRAFDGTLQGILQGTLSLQQGMKNIAQNIAASFEKMAADAILNFIKMSIMQKILGKEGAMAQIKANAASAASGAYNAIVGIPYVGPILAPAAAALAYGAVWAFGAQASAAGGMDIPGGVNPLVQTHAREMILPEKLANVIRNFAATGNSGGQPRSSAPGVRINLPLAPVGGGNFIVTRENLEAHIRNLNRSFAFSS